MPKRIFDRRSTGGETSVEIGAAGLRNLQLMSFYANINVILRYIDISFLAEALTVSDSSPFLGLIGR